MIVVLIRTYGTYVIKTLPTDNAPPNQKYI